MLKATYRNTEKIVIRGDACSKVRYYKYELEYGEETTWS